MNRVLWIGDRNLAWMADLCVHAKGVSECVSVSCTLFLRIWMLKHGGEYFLLHVVLLLYIDYAVIVDRQPCLG